VVILFGFSLKPQAGREQSGRRPALVLSHEDYNRVVGLGVFCPITSKEKGYPFEVKLPDGLDIEGVVLADQIKSLDWKKRNAEYICSVDEKTIEKAINLINKMIN
jgi:mRNA interferase MazF